MAIPHIVPSVPIADTLPGLIFSQDQIRKLWPGRATMSIPDSGFSQTLIAGTILEVEPARFIVLGPLIGEGRQSRVYGIATCERACIKLGMNSIAAKQLRREVLGYSHYVSRSIRCPAILGADSRGRFILKERYPATLINGVQLLRETNRSLPEHCVLALHKYASRFEDDGITVDGLPGNVIFWEDGCGSYETTTWEAPPRGKWTFVGCFLLEWLPIPMPHDSVDSWPPFHLSRPFVESLRTAWCLDPRYAAWRHVFGEFPDLCSEWWVIDGIAAK